MSATLSAPTRRSDIPVRGALAAAAAGTALAVTVIPTPTVDDTAYAESIRDFDRVPDFLAWVLAATTDAQWFGSTAAGLLMLLGAGLAHHGYRRARRWRGFDVACASGLWPWMTASGLLSLLLAHLVWGWTVPWSGSWMPLFVSFVSVAPAIVLCFGPGWPVALTGAALGAGIATPISLATYVTIVDPLGLSSLVAATTGMWAGGLASFAVCRALPWMPPFALGTAGTETDGTPPRPTSPVSTGALPTTNGPSAWSWALRRLLADFTEAPFLGNELAGIGLLVGAVVTALLAPGLPVYGTGLLPQLLAAQLITASLSLALWWRAWGRHGWYPTFIPLVSVAPAGVLAAGGTTTSVIVSAVIGALLAPPLGAALGRRVPRGCHPYVGYTLAMTLLGISVVPLVAALP